MPELCRAVGIRGRAERLGLEQRGQAAAQLQSCKQCLPRAVPNGGHEECAGQAGEEDLCPWKFLCLPVQTLPLSRRRFQKLDRVTLMGTFLPGESVTFQLLMLFVFVCFLI